MKEYKLYFVWSPALEHFFKKASQGQCDIKVVGQGLKFICFSFKPPLTIPVTRSLLSAAGIKPTEEKVELLRSLICTELTKFRELKVKLRKTDGGYLLEIKYQEPDITISLRLPISLARRLHAYCAKVKKSRSEVIREALIEFLDRREKASQGGR